MPDGQANIVKVIFRGEAPDESSPICAGATGKCLGEELGVFRFYDTEEGDVGNLMSRMALEERNKVALKTLLKITPWWRRVSLEFKLWRLDCAIKDIRLEYKVLVIRCIGMADEIIEECRGYQSLTFSPVDRYKILALFHITADIEVTMNRGSSLKGELYVQAV